MIDEVHTLVGAGAVGRGGGGGGGGLDISNLLKPALARGELQCIGATTLDEHRKYIERDGALERWVGGCAGLGGSGAWGLHFGERAAAWCITYAAAALTWLLLTDRLPLSLSLHSRLLPPPALLPSPPCPCCRRFQPVIVDEPTEGEALLILEGLQGRYERHHRVVYSSEAVAAAVALSSRYIPDRYLPDKVGAVCGGAGDGGVGGVWWGGVGAGWLGQAATGIHMSPSC